MSKYIRTENRVYDTSKGIYIPSIKMYAIGTETIYEKDIINQADTIEELCDRVFAFHKEDKWGIPDIEGYYLDGLKEEIIRDHEKPIDDFIFKLAIWTDKGLIYVAQTNDKGELELI